MSESQQPERRREPRHEVPGRAMIRAVGRDADETSVMAVVNVSRSGVLLNLGTARRPPWLEIEASLHMRISLGDGEIAVQGLVVRIVEDRRFRAFAVEFSGVSPATQAAIDDAVQVAARSKGAPPPLPK